MNTDNQLRAIYKLSQKELGHEDYTDVTAWAERAGPEFDTTLLQEKSRERIAAIYKKHYED